MSVLQYHFQDQSDAGRQAGEWVEGVAAERNLVGRPGAELKVQNIDGDGCVYTLWWRGAVIAHAVIVRDGWNYSVLTCMEIPANG